MRLNNNHAVAPATPVKGQKPIVEKLQTQPQLKGKQQQDKLQHQQQLKGQQPQLKGQPAQVKGQQVVVVRVLYATLMLVRRVQRVLHT